MAIKSWSCGMVFYACVYRMHTETNAPAHQQMKHIPEKMGTKANVFAHRMIAEIVGLYRRVPCDEQTEWLRVTLYVSGVKKEARNHYGY